MIGKWLLSATTLMGLALGGVYMAGSAQAAPAWHQPQGVTTAGVETSAQTATPLVENVQYYRHRRHHRRWRHGRYYRY